MSALTRTDVQASDSELVSATRAGDSRAYGVLWDRHAPAALRAARAITRSIDPEDLVSEAFAKTLAAIRNGGGPTDAFRPYLFAAVRNAAATWGGKQKDVALEYIDELAIDDSEDSLDVLSDKALLTAAFTQLPERWRTLLWYLEVEGMKPREIAPLMGLTPNAVSVLALRAREGFKVAWLQAHISESGRDAECRWTCERIVARERRRQISRADRARFESHLERCRRCNMASADLEEASSKLRAVLLPLIIGAPAAAAYTAASPAPASASTGVAADAGSKTIAPWLVVSGAAAAVAIAVSAVAVAGTLAPAGGPSTVDEASAAPTSAPVSAPAGETAPPAELDIPVPVPVTSEPAPGPAEPLDPAERPVIPDRLPGSAVPVPALPVPVLPPAAPTAPDAAPPAGPPVDPPVDRPVYPLVDPPDARPTLTWSMVRPAAVPPPITGTGAPGGDVIILDEAGAIVGSAIVDAEGLFSVQPEPDALHQGMIITAQHTDPVGVTTRSDPIGPVEFDVPSLAGDPSDRTLQSTDADYDGATDDLELSIEAIPGATVTVVLDGDVTATVVLDGSAATATFLDVRPGLHRLALRYTDPQSGAAGPATAETVNLRP